jgi:hypothetical protein
LSFPLESPGLTVAVALAVGLAATALARHLRLPGIVLLLASGVALSRDGLGVIDPEVLGPALQVLVGYAVAVIVFRPRAGRCWANSEAIAGGGDQGADQHYRAGDRHSGVAGRRYRSAGARCRSSSNQLRMTWMRVAGATLPPP